MTLLCLKPPSGCQLTQNKSQSSKNGTTWSGPSVLSLTLLHLQWPPCYCLNMECSQFKGFLLCSSAWNCLPSDILMACSLISFGSLSKCHLVRKPFPNHVLKITTPLPFPVFLYGTYRHWIYHIIFSLFICLLLSSPSWIVSYMMKAELFAC